MGVDIRLDGPGKTPYLRLQISVQDALYCLGIVRGNPRETRFYPAYAQFVQLAGDIEFFIRGETDADGLLPVTQRRVIKMYGLAAVEAGQNIIRPVQLARPNLVL